jgi:transposase
MRINCPQCKSIKLWQLGDGRLRCRCCRQRFSPNKLPVKIKSALLRQIIVEFVLEHSSNTILDRVDISKFKLLKILTLFRIEMTKDVPKIFEGIVEVDETYIGGKWKNKTLRKQRELVKIKRGRGTPKQPVFGILCRNGRVFAEVVEGVEANDLVPLIER